MAATDGKIEMSKDGKTRTFITRAIAISMGPNGDHQDSKGDDDNITSAD